MVEHNHYLRLVVDNSGTFSPRLGVGEKRLEPLVCPNGEPGPLLDAGEKPGIVQHPPTQGGQTYAFLVTECARLLQELAAQRASRLNIHNPHYDGLIHHLSIGKILRVTAPSNRDNGDMDETPLLARLREAFDLNPGKSRREIAGNAKLNPNYFADLFDGTIQSPRTDTLRKIAVALSVSFDWLASGIGEPRPNGKPSGYELLTPTERAMADAYIEALLQRRAADEEIKTGTRE